MNWIPTALSTFLFLGSIWCFWKAQSYADDTFRAAHKLEGARALIRAHEHILANQATQLNRLRGMVYALKRELEAPEPDDPPPPTQLDAVDACDNWKLAQLEGPYSVAAACQCAFCEGMRAEKERVRKLYRPKPATMPTGQPQ